jgi:hypothetical protein
MNDTNFVMGGITDENPVLLAFVHDSNGINTVGNGIGHDIVAILDGNTNQSIVLNDFYESDLDSYRSGVVRYPFFNLEKGLHTLEIKVWDVYNNSSSAYTEFIVESSEELVLNHLFNYPNPFRDYTSFIFEHNQPGKSLEVEILIFSMNGRLVREIREEVHTSGYRTPPLSWDGTSYDGRKLSSGFYVYKVRVNAGDGFTNELSDKLVLIR